MWNGLSSLLQTPKCNFIIWNIYIQMNQCFCTEVNIKSKKTVCEMQSCVWKWCRSGTGGKFCKVSWFIIVTHWRICTVMFVLFTVCVNNIVVPEVDKYSWIRNSAQCNIIRILFVVHRGIYVKYFWPDARYFFFGTSIYYLLVGAEHLSSRHESSDAEISRIF
jgi:hypothetical protein